MISEGSSDTGVMILKSSFTMADMNYLLTDIKIENGIFHNFEVVMYF